MCLWVLRLCYPAYHVSFGQLCGFYRDQYKRNIDTTEVFENVIKPIQGCILEYGIVLS